MIVVTGATGRIGRSVRTSSIAEHIPILCQSRRHLPFDQNTPWFQWIPGKAEGESSLENATAILHLAGTTPTGGTIVDDAQFESANVQMALSVLDAAARHAIPRVLLASSASVYGRPLSEEQVFGEDTPLQPLNAYGRSKMAMERAALSFTAPKDTPEICILRIANVAGADQLLQNALRAGPENPMELDRFPSGHGPLRSYIGPQSLGDTLLKIAGHPAPLPKILNIAAAPPVRMDDLLRALEAHSPVPWRYRIASKTAIERVVVDTRRLDAVYPVPVSGDACADMVAQALAARESEEP